MKKNDYKNFKSAADSKSTTDMSYRFNNVSNESMGTNSTHGGVKLSEYDLNSVSGGIKDVGGRVPRRFILQTPEHTVIKKVWFLLKI